MKSRFLKNPLLVVFLVVLVDLLGYGILIPVIPLLLGDPYSPYYLLSNRIPIQSAYILLGFLLATYPLGQFIATPIIGQLSDKYGRKKLLAISIFGTFLSYIVFAIGILTRNIPLLFISRFFDGITGGNISVAQAAIADSTEPKDRAKNFGLIGTAFGLGFILGPYIGGKLSDPAIISWFNAATPFWFAALLSLINLFAVIIIFPETLKQTNKNIKINWTKSLGNIRKAFNLPKLKPLYITSFLFQGGFSFFTSFFSIYLINKFSFTQGGIGDFFAYLGLWVAFTQGFLVRKISKKFNETKILRFSLLLTGVAILGYFIPTVWWGLLFIAPFFAIFNGLTQTNMLGLISRSTDNNIQGEVLGISSSVSALSQAIPPLLSGFIAAGMSPIAPIIVSSFLILLSWINYTNHYNRSILNEGIIKKNG